MGLVGDHHHHPTIHLHLATNPHRLVTNPHRLITNHHRLVINHHHLVTNHHPQAINSLAAMTHLEIVLAFVATVRINAIEVAWNLSAVRPAGFVGGHHQLPTIHHHQATNPHHQATSHLPHPVPLSSQGAVTQISFVPNIEARDIAREIASTEVAWNLSAVRPVGFVGDHLRHHTIHLLQATSHHHHHPVPLSSQGAVTHCQTALSLVVEGTARALEVAWREIAVNRVAFVEDTQRQPHTPATHHHQTINHNLNHHHQTMAVSRNKKKTTWTTLFIFFSEITYYFSVIF